MSHNNKREGGSSWERRRQTDCVKRKLRVRRTGRIFLFHIDGAFLRCSAAHVTETNPLAKMAKNQEVERIAKKLDKMVHKKNTVSVKPAAASAEKHAIRWWALPLNCWKREISGNTAAALCGHYFYTCGHNVTNIPTAAADCAVCLEIVWLKITAAIG